MNKMKITELLKSFFILLLSARGTTSEQELLSPFRKIHAALSNNQ
jgi:hypothetical protein